MKNKSEKRKFVYLSFAVLALSAACVGEEVEQPTFKKMHLLPSYWSEGANFADLNKDGHMASSPCSAHRALW